jgi:hypothetical protein
MLHVRVTEEMTNNASCRIRSSLDDERTETLKAQTEKIAASCALHDLELVEVYTDAGVSGTVALNDRRRGEDAPDSQGAWP